MLIDGGRLPADATRFFGRSQEAAALRDAVGHSRLVTLIGPGGVGKSRLAIQVARGMRTAFPDGAFLVQLSYLRDPDLLVSTVAAALGLPEQTAPARVEALLPHLRDKRLLLILDTCEHLIDTCATFADALLRGADGPRLLATSRQTLDIPGEVVYPILPFPVPDTGGDAVALFADRASASMPGFTVTAENRAKVIELCRGLDGIPLAIELAAVRLRAVGIEDMLARLGDRLRLLGGSSRQADVRHQTLRATISWSHDLCSEGERLLWARLSVFAGEFGLQAMERVCGGDGLDPTELVDTLVRLVDKSIVIRIDGAEGGARYRMLDTIREFGAELLAEAGEYRRRHRDYYLAVAREFDAAFIGPGQVWWVRRIMAEQANLRLALEFCLSDDDAEVGLELATALWGFWACANRVGEGRYWLGRMLDRVPAQTVLQVKGLWLAGWFKEAQGERGGSESLLEQARSIAVATSDALSLAWVDGFTAHARANRDEREGVADAYTDVLDRMTRLGDMAGICINSLNKAIFHELADEHAECVAECGRLLARLPEGECWLRGWGLWVKSIALWRTRDLAEFADCQRAGLVLRLRFGDMLGLATCLEGLAWLASAEGDFVRTARLLGAAERMWRSVASVPRFGMTRLDAEHDAAKIRAKEALGERLYAREHAAGAALSADDAVRYARDSADAADQAARPGEHAAAAAAPASPWEQLTPRERQVAALVAQGMTNREIAARLVVSKRTIDAHVEHILAKLGFSSRVQVAALAAVPASRPGEATSPGQGARSAEFAPLLRDQAPPDGGA
ncbi:MAG TPA: LuxR C-terminal-related transcriptional regulator [Trebonia sp.]|nr:LuxR C-terminal-related transcriptional regulator [Trebonia sp.]